VEQGTDSDYEYYSDDEKQQLSLVCVLECHPFEVSMSSPAHGKLSPSSKYAMDVFRPSGSSWTRRTRSRYSPTVLGSGWQLRGDEGEGAPGACIGRR
jgi:hypothetical protein